MNPNERELEQYEIDYISRRDIPEEWMLEFEKLQLAAFLEHQIKVHTITVSDARRRFVRQYPDSNRAPVSRKIIDENNEYTYDNNYIMGSVIWLIQPFDDSIWDIPRL